MPGRAVILASASPRRAELLRLAGLRFAIRPSEIDETPRPSETPRHVAERLARSKALALASPAGPALVIAADTVVAVGGTILGKPLDTDDATRMLRLLAGRTHEVTTGLALRLVPEEELACESVTSRVTFVAMSDEETLWYARSGEGMDKAGAYALQGIGSLFVASIDGSYTNVIGLPMERLHPHLRRHDLLPAR